MKTAVFFFLPVLLLSGVWAHAQNVGIGTVTPQAKVHIAPDNAAGILLSAYGVNPGQTGELRFSGITGTGHIALKAPDDTPSPIAFTLPSTYGTNGQALTTNGTGLLQWSNVSQSQQNGGGCCLPTMISNESPGNLTLGQSLQYCDTLTEGGYTDWRMPTFEELLAAVGGTATIPGGRNGSVLRSTSISGTNGSYYVNLKLDNGDQWYFYGSSTDPNYKCRCVR